MAPNDTILRLRLEMRVAESTGVINLAIPALMLDMMRQKFDHQRTVKESSPEDQSRLLDLLQAARVEVDARLLDQQILAKDVLALRVGDVLTFDTMIDAPIDLVFNGRRHLRGQVISLGKK